MVTVVAMSAEKILKADCRLIYDGHTAQRGPKVHCLKAVIAVETGLNMWEFSLMCGDRLLQDRDDIFCHRMAMLRDNRHQMTLQMVHHNLDTRHVTMRRFPMQWIHDTKTFLGKAKRLCTQFGEVVEIVDVSDQHRRQDDDRDGERTLEVKYLQAESGIRAMRGLSGGDIGWSEIRVSEGKEIREIRKEQKFVCMITGSPVVIEHCDCDDGADCRAMCRIVWRPLRCPCEFRWRRPPPGANVFRRRVVDYSKPDFKDRFNKKYRYGKSHTNIGGLGWETRFS